MFSVYLTVVTNLVNGKLLNDSVIGRQIRGNYIK